MKPVKSHKGLNVVESSAWVHSSKDTAETGPRDIWEEAVPRFAHLASVRHASATPTHFITVYLRRSMRPTGVKFPIGRATLIQFWTDVIVKLSHVRAGHGRQQQ